MMKKIIGITVLVGVLGLLAFGALNRTYAKSETVESALVADVTGEERGGSGNGFGGNGDLNGDEHVYGEGEPQASIDLLPVGVLDQTEIDALLYMREEEKLARDVYNVLYAQWNIPVFGNIASSEQTHMDFVLTLLDRYGLVDPASSEAGVFSNAILQSLYDQLVASGSQSLENALLAGGAIEEIDILDLKIRLEQTDQLDIQQVFENLLMGSYNHLNSFASQYNAKVGTPYVPQYLSLEEYQSILTTETNGVGGGGGRGNRGGGH